MKYLVELPSGSGPSILAEVDEDTLEPGLVQAARPGEVVAKAAQTVEEALDRVKPVVATMIEKLHDVSASVDQISLELGLKVGVKSGFIIAEGTAEANIKLTFTWKRP